MAKQRAEAPRGLKAKPTVTSLMRKDVGRKVADSYDIARSPPKAPSSANRTSSVYRLGKPAMKVLPPLQRAPGSRRGFSRGVLGSATQSLQ
jgi:hypothetical protein